MHFLNFMFEKISLSVLHRNYNTPGHLDNVAHCRVETFILKFYCLKIIIMMLHSKYNVPGCSKKHSAPLSVNMNFTNFNVIKLSAYKH